MIPSATYSPWESNQEFLQIYKKIKKYTTLDVMRLYELWYLDDQIKDLSGDYIEIGVYKGEVLHSLQKKIQKINFFCVILFKVLSEPVKKIINI